MRSLEKSCEPIVGLLDGSPNVTPPSQDEIQSANPLAGGCLLKGLRDRNASRNVILGARQFNPRRPPQCRRLTEFLCAGRRPPAEKACVTAIRGAVILKARQNASPHLGACVGQP